MSRPAPAATRFPAFFDEVPPIVLHDPLAEFLGAARGGLIAYHFADAVRLAGHACPTVAAAWLMTTRGLQALWPDATPVRGGVRLAMRGQREEGVTGVIAKVAELLTGAAGSEGFKGLAGRFDRRAARFGADEIAGELALTRTDTGQQVEVAVDLSRVPPDPAMRPFMEKCLEGTASSDEAAAFGRLWQDRVRRILLASPDAGIVRVRAIG